MKKKIAILGSTGSIGKSLLKIVDNNSDFEVVLLSANKNYKELIKQTKRFKVKNIIISNNLSLKKFKKINKNKNIKIFQNYENLNEIFKSKIDYTMSAITGIDGLNPTIKIIKHTKKIAIANKESIICGWNLIKRNLKKYKTKFIPVDSEHFSIWYALQNLKNRNIDKIFLTASGGPLLNYSDSKINNVRLKDVLKHPNWKMGKKISIDSSTMINKVFEIIEAKNIFEIKYEKLNIVIHPQSYIHAIVQFNNGMMKIVAHETTMKIPIFNSLYDNGIYFKNSKNFRIEKLNNLNFEKINIKKFPSLKILKYLPQKISLFETVIVSANDTLVNLYLNGKIKYKDIIYKLLKIISLNEFVKLKKISPKSVSEIINLDKYVRLKITSKSV
jgi:1-deoxy-D-xylulose-5-phosphate reductoisomerase